MEKSSEAMSIEALKESVIIGKHLQHDNGGWLYYDLAVKALQLAGVDVDSLAGCACHSPLVA